MKCKLPEFITTGGTYALNKLGKILRKRGSYLNYSERSVDVKHL